jgi:hypothetical protein
MVIYGPNSRLEFDQSRYSSASAEMIEAALRFELSQDVDELRQLGAVDDSFRKLSLEEAAEACYREREA